MYSFRGMMRLEIAIIPASASKNMAILRMKDNTPPGYHYLPTVSRSIRYSGRPRFAMLF